MIPEDGRGAGVTSPAYSSSVLATTLSALSLADGGVEDALVTRVAAGSAFITVDVQPVNDAPTVVIYCRPL